MKLNGISQGAAKRPWHIAHVSRLKSAVVMGADNSVVAVCHADNADIIVKAVNAYQFTSPTAGRAGEAETAEATQPNLLQEVRA